jgi:hypothetical protein
VLRLKIFLQEKAAETTKQKEEKRKMCVESYG